MQAPILMIFHLLLLLIRIPVYEEITGDANKMNFANIPDSLRHILSVAYIYLLFSLPSLQKKKFTYILHIYINMK